MTDEIIFMTLTKQLLSVSRTKDMKWAEKEADSFGGNGQKRVARKSFPLAPRLWFRQHSLLRHWPYINL
jgi:hypothetical protein